MPIYQQFHTALLQAYRAKYLLQRARSTRSHRIKHAVHLVYKLQHRLTWFVDILRSYYTENVVAFTSRDMEAAMEKAEDIDQMADIHVKYVAKLQERALLSSDLRPIHKAVIEMLDLGVLFAKTVTELDGSSHSQTQQSAPRRKSSVPLLDQVELSDTDEDVEEGEDFKVKRASRRSAGRTPTEALQTIDKEFARLLPFITAGLRSVGRVGAEPMWEQLAERLEWEGKKDRY
jgi:gamma-tubulin complex component 5